VRVQFVTASNLVYRIEYAPALPAQNWIALTNIVVGTGGISVITDFNAATQSHRFYRALQQQ